MTYFLSPSLDQLRAEINARWPGRDKASDGWIGDLAHSTRASDHNPDDNGSVNAFDVDKDGIDPWALVLTVMRDPRTANIIWSGRIYIRSHGFMSEPYYGKNGHYAHVHISIQHGDQFEQSRAPWGISTPLTPEVPDMDASQNQRLVNAEASAKRADEHATASERNAFNALKAVNSLTVLVKRLTALVAKTEGEPIDYEMLAQALAKHAPVGGLTADQVADALAERLAS